MRHAGGAERYVEQLRAGFAAAGDEVALLTSSVGSAAERGADFVAWGTEAPLLQSVVQIVNPPALAATMAARRRFQPDAALVVMFANHLSPATFAALRGLPTIHVATDFKLVCPTFAKTLPDGSTCHHAHGWVCRRERCVGTLHWLRDRPRYAALRAALRSACRVLTCSERVRHELSRGGIAAEHLPAPVDPPGAAFARRPAATPLFVYSGRLAHQKGVLPLARSFARLRAEHPDARLRVVGDGPERIELERELARLGLAEAVELTGWLAFAEVEARLADAWAVVAPTRGPEPLGLVALEAIVRGVPAVATRNGGFVETIVEGDSGLLVEDGDEDDLLRALRAVATRAVFADHRVPPELVGRARAKHDPARHIAALREIFAEEIERRRRARATA